jgi:hypothetical protein
MYANTGIATDSARVNRANRWARLIAGPCRRLFTAKPLPGLPDAVDPSLRPARSSPVLSSGLALQPVEFRSERAGSYDVQNRTCQPGKEQYPVSADM